MSGEAALTASTRKLPPMFQPAVGETSDALIDGVLLRPLPVRAEAELVVGWRGLPEVGARQWPFSADDLALVRTNSRLLASVAGVGYQDPGTMPLADGFSVWADIEGQPIVVCRRAPGEPYRPAVFTTAEEAREVASHITSALRPGPDANFSQSGCGQSRSGSPRNACRYPSAARTGDSGSREIERKLQGCARSASDSS